MDGALDITTSQELQSIAGVDGQGGILRLNPLPLVRVRVANLERSDGLTEEESEGPEVCGCEAGQHENLIGTWRESSCIPVCPEPQFESFAFCSGVYFEYFM
jgi:hypothetical protein